MASSSSESISSPLCAAAAAAPPATLPALPPTLLPLTIIESPVVALSVLGRIGANFGFLCAAEAAVKKEWIGTKARGWAPLPLPLPGERGERGDALCAPPTSLDLRLERPPLDRLPFVDAPADPDGVRDLDDANLDGVEDLELFLDRPFGVAEPPPALDDAILDGVEDLEFVFCPMAITAASVVAAYSLTYSTASSEPPVKPAAAGCSWN